MSRSEAAFEEALAIGDALARTASWSGDRCSWIVSHRETGPHGAAMAYPADGSVLVGTAGIALFLARLRAHGGASAHARTARAALRHALAEAGRNEQRAREAFAARTGGAWALGHYSGALGIAWAAAEASRLLGDDDVTALRLARRLLARPLPREAPGDLMQGSAGAIAVALALDVGDAPLDALSRHALARAGSEPGMAHGAAGVAWALSLLPERRADAHPLAEAAGEARGSSWCRGAAGAALALARLGAPRAAIRRLRDEAASALPDLLRRPGESFTPCCGIAGTAECLWLVDEALGIPGALARAQRVAQWGLERFRVDDRWGSWPIDGSLSPHPGLLQGLAGVGHFLLRLHAPRRVPTILLPIDS